MVNDPQDKMRAALEKITRGLLKEGEELTDADMRRMDLIAVELERFYNQMKLKYGKTVGRA